MGRFKGTIEIVNSDLKKKFEDEKEELLEGIFESLRTLAKKTTGEDLEFDLECVESAEAKANFENDCEKMGLKMPKLTDFLESIAFGGMIKELLKK